jgi:hypothetical protein
MIWFDGIVNDTKATRCWCRGVLSFWIIIKAHFTTLPVCIVESRKWDCGHDGHYLVKYSDQDQRSHQVHEAQSLPTLPTLSAQPESELHHHDSERCSTPKSGVMDLRTSCRLL